MKLTIGTLLAMIGLTLLIETCMLGILFGSVLVSILSTIALLAVCYVVMRIHWR